MDADFSHDPGDIPRLLTALADGSDFVIGSRYVPGGSIPSNWSAFRKANSKWGNIFARYIAGLRGVRDCTSGYRAIRASTLLKIELSNLAVTGYAFQMSLLHAAVNCGATVTEIPIKFADRVRGESKIGIADIVEFMIKSFEIRLSMIFKRRAKRAEDQVTQDGVSRDC
jgi:dolichol-phosphate mannosyltransferase